jgi:hypothetical protein
VVACSTLQYKDNNLTKESDLGGSTSARLGDALGRDAMHFNLEIAVAK